MKTFYDKQCTIYSRTFAIIKGREQEQQTLLYDRIACDFYHTDHDHHRPTTDARETLHNQYEVVLDGAYDVATGMIIELIDGATSYGQYLIDEVQVHRLPDGTVDNTMLHTQKI